MYSRLFFCHFLFFIPVALVLLVKIGVSPLVTYFGHRSGKVLTNATISNKRKAECFLLLLNGLFVDRSAVKNIGESYWNTRAVGEQSMLLVMYTNGELIIMIVVTVVLGVDLNEVGNDVKLLEKVNFEKNEMKIAKMDMKN